MKHGNINRLILPPSKAICIVEYLIPSEAKNAFKTLSYSKFHDVPLYLEWAPEKIMNNNKSKTDKSKKKIEKKDDDDDKVEDNEEEIVNEKEEVEVEVDDELIAATIFVKNLNFTTTEDKLKQHFISCGEIRSATIARKRNPTNKTELLSLGYGFIEFTSKESAIKAVKTLQGSILEDHKLELSYSKRENDDEEKKRKRSRGIMEGKPTTKLLVRNLAFQATRNDLRELFGAYGELKSIRIPKKFDGSNRGFGFVEFLTKDDTKSAFEHLQKYIYYYYNILIVLTYMEEN